MKLSLLISFLLLFSAGNAQALPAAWMNIFKSKGLEKKYSPNAFVKPAYLQADFTGDGVPDVAVPVMEKNTSKRGILVIHGKTGDYFLFGAGTVVADSDNFTWADKWSLYTKKIAYETQFDKESGDITGGKEVRLSRPAILVEDYEDGAALAGGIIYWNGKKYIWIHQGE